MSEYVFTVGNEALFSVVQSSTGFEGVYVQSTYNTGDLAESVMSMFLLLHICYLDFIFADEG